MVVTDGYSSTGIELVQDKAHLMKENGIEIFTIGITNRINEEELIILCSTPIENHLFKLNCSKAVRKIVKSIVKQVCK